MEGRQFCAVLQAQCPAKPSYKGNQPESPMCGQSLLDPASERYRQSGEREFLTHAPHSSSEAKCNSLQASGVLLGRGQYTVLYMVPGPSRLIFLLLKCTQMTQQGFSRKKTNLAISAHRHKSANTLPDLHVQPVHNLWVPIPVAWIKCTQQEKPHREW